jgi:acyl carrier protein
MAASSAHQNASARQPGLYPLTLADGEQVLQRVLYEAPVCCAAARVDVREWFESAPRLAAWPYLRELAVSSSAPRKAARADAELLSQLAIARGEQRLSMALARVQRELAAVLRVDEAQLSDPRIPFMELGLESLLALELRNRLEAVLDLHLPTTLVFTQPNALALSKALLQRLDQRTTSVASPHAPLPVVAAAPTSTEDDPFDTLSDAELVSFAANLSGGA